MSDIPENGPGREAGFPIVGIGASAGGLEALSQMLSRLPARTGMAFIVIQHLDPHQKSHLVELLSRATALAVVEAADGMHLEPERVHVIPPNRSLTLQDGTLRLTPREAGPGAHMPINLFMRSLAETARDKSIGVILSGTGTDGTLGLSEIKAAGGVTFVQDPESARHGGMPQSAVAEGVVDYVLAPAEIAEELAGICHHPYFSATREGDDHRRGEEGEGDFGKIIRLLRGSSGVDFTHYRDTTLKRRILRRMALHKLESTAEYARLLNGNSAELQALYREILINVTRFFRDPQVFDALKAKVFPEIHRSKSAGSPIRIWVAGCASGEEAYSLAIALREFQDGEPHRPPIRIFATDISETPSLERARSGLYPESIETDVSAERLRRFFTKEAMGYRINKDIRDLCTFARHNVTVDPPFSKVDLLSCRNLLIYLGAPLQRKILPTFHYALNATGFLLLGNSETVGRESELFHGADAKMKIYSKKLTSTRTPISFSQDKPLLTAGLEKVRSTMTMPSDYEKMADRVLLRRFAPSGVLVNRDMDILQFRGRTSPYLEPPQGDAKFNLVKMAQEILFLELRSAIQECDRANAVVNRRGVRIRDGKQIREVNLEIIPVRPPETGENCFLILFDESESAPQGVVDAADGQAGKPGHSAGEELSQLRLELKAARDYLETIREQHDAVNEELKSSNEEILSSNEELQSTNEELETAKEELQSTNEELSTMNDELRSRNQELNQVNNDLNNLLGSVGAPIVMLGNDLRIRKFTPSAAKLLEFKPQDVGLAILDTHSFLDARDLDRMAREVIITMASTGRDVQDREGRWHALRMLPYRTSDNRIDGAVLVLTDIDDSKRAQEQLKELAAFTGSIVATVREPILILDKDLRIQSVNASFYQTFGGTPQDTEYHLIYAVGQGRWNIPGLRTLLEEIIPKQSSFQDFEVEIEVQGSGRRVFKLNARQLAREENGKKLILLAFEDFTENREVLRSTEERLQQSQKMEDIGKLAGGVAHDFNNLLTAINGYTEICQSQLKPEDPVQENLREIRKAGERASSLTRKLLAYSRKQVLAPKVFNLNFVIADMQHMLSSLVGERIKIATVLDPALEQVKADTGEVEQVLLNLVVNARDAMPDGGVITVETRNVEAHWQDDPMEGPSKGAYVLLSVKDAGTGMDETTKRRIFDPFFTTKAVGKGSGLGLSMVQGMIAQSRGHIELDSEPGKGTIFRIYLPAFRIEDNGGGRAPENPSSAPAGKETILLVDDEDIVRVLTRQILAMYGYAVLEARDGQEALSIAERHPGTIHMLLSDLVMPGMNGRQVAEKFSALRPDSRILFMSGYAHDVILSQDLGMEGFTYVQKPFTPAFLAKTVRETLGQESPFPGKGD